MGVLTDASGSPMIPPSRRSGTAGRSNEPGTDPPPSRETSRSRDLDFNREQTVIFALAGTVPLPSPFPAYGRLSLGVFPVSGEINAATARFYLKTVQAIGDREVETRMVRLEDLRAVKYRSANMTAWTLK